MTEDSDGRRHSARKSSTAASGDDRSIASLFYSLATLVPFYFYALYSKTEEAFGFRIQEELKLERMTLGHIDQWID